MLQSLDGYHQNILGAFHAAAEDGGAAEPAQSPRLQFDFWHLLARTSGVWPPGSAPPCPPCGDQSRVVQYDRGRQVAPYRLPHDHTYRVGPRLQPSPTEGVLAVAEVKSWWLRRRKHPAHGSALWQKRSCPRARTPAAEVVAACLNSTGHTPTPHTHHRWFHVGGRRIRIFPGRGARYGMDFGTANRVRASKASGV